MLEIPGYQFFEIIYQGRNSIIYRGMKLKDEQQSVIIKLPITLLPNTQGADKLRREWEMRQLVDSKHVVQYQALEDNATYGCILIEADDQAEALARHIPAAGFEISTFLSIALQLAEGLQEIHQSNIVHNDIKPNNVIFQPDTGKVKYIDFGSASPLHQIKQVVISPDVSGGTLSYLSPEQTGRTNRLLDYRTDFYSLGVTFYQLLCGRLPFEVKNISQLIHCHIAKQPAAPHQRKLSIPKPLSDIVMKLLSKDAEDRYQSAQGLLIDLKKCAEDLKTKGEIIPFSLAQQDVPERFYIPQKLYGREPELALIMQTFDRVASQGIKSEVLMITGHAGTGKSMLVNEIQPLIAAKKGYFLTGKFEQANRNMAYSAIAHAFQTWIKQVLAGNEEEILTWKTQLLTALRNQGQLLIDVMPHLEWIIGKQSPLPPLDPEQTKNRFHWVFQQFITVLAQSAHPLVLFLDDWHWADVASLALLETLMANPDTQNLLLIGAYRDNEVDDSHPALLSLVAIQKAGIAVQSIPLSPLTETSVNQWVAEAMHCSADLTRPLTALLYQKTEGNPFFIRVFLQALYEQQVLKLTQEGWQWDLHTIHQLPATENVIAFMARQIQQLPVKMQGILKRASCLGYRFTHDTLQQMIQTAPEQGLVELHVLVDSGFLLQTEEGFQFIHDRIQEAAYGLIAQEERALLHLSIGRLLQARLSTEPTLKQEFEVADHLNQGKILITEPEEQLALAQLNLKTAQRAKAAAAYATALNYLHAGESYFAGIENEIVWQKHYMLAYDFYKTLAEVEYLNDNFDASTNYMNLILKYVRTDLEKVDIYTLRIIQKTVMAHYQEAIEVGYQALRLLGVDLQAQDLPQLLSIEANKIKENLKNKTMQALLKASFMSDVTIKAIMKLLDNLIAASYIGDPPLHALIATMMVSLTLHYGNTEESAFGYSSYGMLLVAKFNEMQLGHDFGLLAIQLSDQFHHLPSQCRTNFVHGIGLHNWRKPLRQVAAYFDRAQQAGLAAGEFQYLGYSLQAKATCFFYQGTPLTAIAPELNKHLQLPYVRANQSALGSFHALQLVIFNLRGQTPEETAFQDEIKTDMDYQADWQQQKNFYVLTHYLIFKAQALYLHGQFAKALAALCSAQRYLAFIACNIAVSAQNFYHSLVLAALYPTVENTETQQHYWQQLETNQAQLKLWADNCPENFLHKYLLIAAEMARVQRKDWEAIELYDQAIQAAQKQGFIQDHALACELAAQFWLAVQRTRCAQAYLYDAYHSYAQWGAKRKIQMLSRYYPELLKSAPTAHLSSFPISSEETIKASSLALLDLTSVLRASQAIASEIELSKLLSQMMQVVIENAGAQTGAFWLAEADTLWLQAECNAEGHIQTLQKLPLVQWEKGSRLLVEYVKRTQQPVLLGDVSHDPQFNQDLYISTHHIKSVLCMPLIRQKQLKGILYLENNLLSHAFTEQHQQILTLLASQIAISLENAILFEATRSITERLNLALQSGNVGIWSWNMRENKVRWDEGMYTLFGVNKEEFGHTRESYIALIHPDDRVDIERAIELTLTENVPYNPEYRIIRPADQSIHVMTGHGKVYHDDKGLPEHMIGIAWDITQRKRLEEERFQALQQAEEKERQRAEEAERHRKEQEEFIDTVCHEIRNPMSGIYGNVDFLKQIAESLKTLRDTLPINTQLVVEETRRKLEESTNVIEQCIKHQKAIIDDVLNVSKLEAGKVTLALKPFRPKTLIENTLRLYAMPLAAKHLTLQLALPEQAMAVQGDPDRFNIILMNLISNAIKFTEQGYIKVSLQTQAVSPTQVALTLSIEDTGVGMTQEQQFRLFQRFSRPVSSQYEGSGLGLTITKKIIDLMEGTIQVKSEPERGSQFTVYLVCESVAPEVRISPLISKKSVVLQPTALPVFSKHILVVEDNLVNQRILKRQLEQAGYQCTVANNGQEAVEKCQQIAFDLIFMDREMPVMDGLEATKQIRKQEKELNRAATPVIGLSAYARTELVEEGLAAGMNAYLTKPYEKEKLYDAIRQWTAPSDKKSSSEQDALSKTKAAIETEMRASVFAERVSKPMPPTEISQKEMESACDRTPSPFWSNPSLQTTLPPPRTWMPKLLRNCLYPLFDRLSVELHSLGIHMVMPAARFQAYCSSTGWQLYSITGKEEHWAALNLAHEMDVDKLITAIQRSGAQLQAKKMESKSVHAIVIVFSTQISLQTEIEKIIMSIRALSRPSVTLP